MRRLNSTAPFIANFKSILSSDSELFNTPIRVQLSLVYFACFICVRLFQINEKYEYMHGIRQIKRRTLRDVKQFVFTF